MSPQITTIIIGIITVMAVSSSPLPAAGMRGVLADHGEEIATPDGAAADAILDEAKITPPEPLDEVLLEISSALGATKASDTSGEEGQNKEEDQITITSKIESKKLWSFVGLTVMLIFGTMIFEHSKESLVTYVKGSPMEPLVNNLFSELTVLGFLGVVTFVLGKVGLSHISTRIFGSTAEEKHELHEMLERIHMVIFLIMVIFMMEAMGMILNLNRVQKKYIELESSVLLPSGRVEAVRELKEAEEQSFWWGECALNLTPRARRYNRALKKVEFMMLRMDFINFKKDQEASQEGEDTRASLFSKGKMLRSSESIEDANDQTSKSTDPSDQHHEEQFSFYLYITKVTGHRLAEVVEIPVRQWGILLAVIIVFVGCTDLVGGYYTVMLHMWLGIGWGLLFCVHLALAHLKGVLFHFQHEGNGMSLLEASPSNRAIESKPRYLVHNDEERFRWLPRWFVGPPAKKNVHHQKMLNLMTFGRNEVFFHMLALRFVFLAMAVYVSVFNFHIVRGYLVKVYSMPVAAGIACLGLLPVALVYFVYIFDVVETSVLVTSIEFMRNRPVIDQVVRHEKEARCVALMRLIAVILDKQLQVPLSVADVASMEKALLEDMQSEQAATPSNAVAKYVSTYLEDTAGEVVMARMIAIFDGMDVDGSGSLSIDEIHRIFKEIGFDNSDEIDGCLQPMLQHIDLRAPMSPRHENKALPPPQYGLCSAKRDRHDDTSKIASRDDVAMSKAVFLAWFLVLEKASRELSTEQVSDVWFSVLDDDKSGCLNVTELQEVLETCGKAFNPSEVSALILELDANGDGEFDKHEFAAWIAKHAPSFDKVIS